MSDNVMFSSEPAEKLNNQVTKKIGKHLFLVCNYNPGDIKVFGEDAKFLQAILNLYKVLIDASICNNFKGFSKKYGVYQDYEKVEKIINEICLLRTVLSHNVDDKNGSGYEQDNFGKWLFQAIGKKELTCAADYEKAVAILRKEGEDFVSLFEKIIDNISKNQDKMDIILDWEKLIINFYKRPNSKKIFEDQLLMAYQSRLGNLHIVEKIEVAGWVKKGINYKEQSQINNLQLIIRGKSFPEKVLRDISIKIDENQRIIDERIKSIADVSKKEASELHNWDYWDYYIGLLPQKIEDEINKKNGISLLPQEIVQEIIEKDFNGVSTV